MDYKSLTDRLMQFHKAIDPVNAFGGYGNVAAMALPMGRAMPFKIEPLNEVANWGGLSMKKGATVTQLPGAGVRIGYDVTHGSQGGYHADIAFDRTARAMKTGAREGVDALARVGSGVKEFINKIKPESLSFSAAYNELIPIYDKVARSLAKEYGGTAQMKNGRYFIQFPNFKQYPPK